MTPDQELAELLKTVRRLELRSEKMIGALGAGRYRSRFKGQGMEFEEVREYAPGDDVRHIDWNVTARHGGRHAFIKTFREERDLTVMLLIDVSASMRYGAIPGISPRSKTRAAAEAAALVAISAMQGGDRIGLLTFADAGVTHLAPRKGRHHAMRLLRECLASNGRGGTDLTAALEHFLQAQTKRCVCFLVSDFLDPQPGLSGVLARAARRHDLIGIRISDPAEASLPAGGPLVLHDPESGREAVFANNRAGRARYANAYAAGQQHVANWFANAGCDLIDLATSEDALTAVRRCFARRRTRG
ncbi:MAG: DUF58 domain-containing protein [Planctomycetota bacterium]|jgi:uncharacterized protein (DUF58 family)